MIDTLPILAVLLAYYYSPIVIALLWAKFTSLAAVKSLMLFYAKLHFATITLLFLYGITLDMLCDGRGFKGFNRCAFVPVEAVNQTLPIILLVYAGLAALAVGVVIYSGTKELRNSRAPDH